MEGFDAFARKYNSNRRGEPLRQTRILIVVIDRGAGAKTVPEGQTAEQKPTGPLSTLDKERPERGSGRAPQALTCGAGQEAPALEALASRARTPEARVGALRAETAAALFAGLAGGFLAAATLAALGVAFGGR